MSFAYYYNQWIKRAKAILRLNEAHPSPAVFVKNSGKSSSVVGYYNSHIIIYENKSTSGPATSHFYSLSIYIYIFFSFSIKNKKPCPCTHTHTRPVCVCVCVIYICTPGGKTAPIGAKDLVESFHPQVNEISSNIQRYGLFLAFSPIFCFLYISFCYYNILSSVVMYISNLSAIYRHWGHGREREPLGANGFDLFFNPIIYRMAIKRKQQHRPNPPEKKRDKNGWRFHII